MQFLLACSRANVGLKAGRYMFEARIVETQVSSHGGHGDNWNKPKQVVRLGLSTAGSSLFLGDGPNNVYFESDGFFVHEKTRQKCGPRIQRDQTVALLLNLDAASPNANTVSLFVNGKRASQPQALPESLVGKPLFPTIAFKGVSLEVNFGPLPRVALPFSCRMVGDAAAVDTEAAQMSTSTGKNQVVFPVGLPEQGYFDWVDEFCEKNPGFIELSDRRIIEWAVKSGVGRKSHASGSNDKPSANMGIPSLDDWSVRKVITSVAPLLGRNYIVPELRANLLPSERQKNLKHFVAKDFERKAVVVMGQPTASYKQRVQELLVAAKKEKARAEKEKKAREEERKRLLELKKAKAEEAKKQRLAAAQRKKEGKEEPVEEPKEEDEKKVEDVKMEEPEVEPELTEEEKKLSYRKTPLPDISEQILAKSYANFALPTKEEGFDAISYEWQSEQDVTTLLKSWVLEKKLTQRAEDLTPGADFKEKWASWQKTLQAWKQRQSEFKNPGKRKALLAKKVEAAKKAIVEEQKTLLEAGSEEAAKELEEKAIKDAQPKEIDLEDLDVLSVEDVMDVGSGEPLFSKFAYEDWTLLSLRYEIHLMLHSFKKDLNDPDRASFGEKHFSYYYNKYTKKTWNQNQFGVKTLGQVLAFIKDTVTIAGTSDFLTAEQAEDTSVDMFVKLAEDHRRERERRVDAGDETAKLKFSNAQVSVPAAAGQKRPYSPAQPAFVPNKVQVRPAAYNFPGGVYGAHRR
eukprot:TRINITY_DN892_c0_g2_i1.p1 TRINITY_DN892_c0_g2~~TRINITY_DN892_c0_g2_i1.p1  ORF type:complete len:869 (-),score=256.49 TRINITY_DN892_c0_g2_i1:48-2276(-)